MSDRRWWSLVLLFWGVSVMFPAVVRQPLSFAQPSEPSSGLGGHVSEEDLPPEEPRAPAREHESSPPPLPATKETKAAVPPASLPPPASREMQATTTPVLLALPTNASLPPQELAALRFVETGKDLLEKGDDEGARDQFERALAIAPFQPYGYYFLGRLAFTRGDAKQALAFLRKAELSFAPGEQAWLSETTGLQGAIYEELGDYPRARIAYQHCLQLTPTNLKALSALARLPEEERLPSDPVRP